jgi:superoxide dismutase
VNHSIFWKNLKPISVSVLLRQFVVSTVLVIFFYVALWKIMWILNALQEGGGEPPHGKLGWAIDEDFGSFEALVKKMNAEGAALQGSGWVVCILLYYALFMFIENS